MRYRRTLAAAASVGAIGALALAAATGAESPSVTSFFSTRLTGAAEVPGPGDPDGRGRAFIRVDTDDGTICYNVFVLKIAPATMAHIHVGGRNVAGPVVQGLEPPTDGYSSGCVQNAMLAEAIENDPDNYYVNVHNNPYPGGAVRGQLD